MFVYKHRQGKWRICLGRTDSPFKRPPCLSSYLEFHCVVRATFHVQILANEKRLKVEIEELHGKIAEGKKEIEKCKAAMADELALKRLKAANETIEMLQRKIAATKQVCRLFLKYRDVFVSDCRV